MLIYFEPSIAIHSNMSWISLSFGERKVLGSPPRKKTKIDETSETTSLPIPHSCSDNWLEKYKPKHVSELAVNVKKIVELENWLRQSIESNSTRKILLLRGPSGCGKTTSLQVVCKKLDLRISEWITPTDKFVNDLETSGCFKFTEGAAKQFEEFLVGCSRYNSCINSRPKGKVILVKDFPNVFLHSPTTFHEVLKNFSARCIHPLVFICSDGSQCRMLFPFFLTEICRVQTLFFYRIPDQQIYKVLKSILFKETKIMKNGKILTDEAIFEIGASCEGDLRSAISKLSFYSTDNTLGGFQPKFKHKQRKLHFLDENPLKYKDEKIDFFHGIGRVLYPKIVKSDIGVKFIQSIDTIVDNFNNVNNSVGLVTQLYENYPTRLGNMYEVSEAANWLSKSDMLMTQWQDADMFRSYALTVAVRGIMVPNKNPQKAKFEMYGKSKTSNLEVNTKATELQGKMMFFNLCALDYMCLLDVLPYSRVLPIDLDHNQLNYVVKTCEFK